MQQLNSKAVLSAVLALAVSSLFCLSSLTTFASNSEVISAISNRPAAGFSKSPTGVLGGTGTLSLNGVSSGAGATVFSGSIITTGHDGIATVDLGPVGRLVVRPRTSVTVTTSPGSATISDRARATRVSVLRGQVILSSAGAALTLKSGENAVFADAIEATMSSDTVFTIQDQGAQKDQGQKDSGTPDQTNPAPSPSPSPGSKRKTAVIVPWWGWLGLAGAAGGIAAGIATHGEERTPQGRVSSSLP